MFILFKRLVYLIFSLSIVFYALPRINLFSNNLNELIFSSAWIVFALIVIGAQLLQLLIIDEDRRRERYIYHRSKLLERERAILTAQAAKRIV